ncbi:MAG TPA: biotin/lipoyl-containing protein, partial [Planctomycetota bacterium]|nr:biotin/lipoyl-containing protein [Planctomycetota bacterium]
MPTELKVPAVGESVTEVQIGSWLVGEGQPVAADDPLVELESDKATVELPAPVAGIVTKILKASGQTAAIGEVIGYVEEGAGAAQPAAPAQAAPAPANAAPAPA